MEEAASVKTVSSAASAKKAAESASQSKASPLMSQPEVSLLFFPFLFSLAASARVCAARLWRWRPVMWSNEVLA
jgi:hypothetical protein